MSSSPKSFTSRSLRTKIRSYIRQASRPCKVRSIAADLSFSSDKALQKLEKELKAMCKNGELLLNHQGHYSLTDSTDLVRGKVISHPAGYGFLVPDTGEDDLYIAPLDMRLLLHGDHVLVRRIPSSKKADQWEASLVEVLQRNVVQVVGTLYRTHKTYFVHPVEKRIPHDILIPPHNNLSEMRQGQYVAVRITDYPDGHVPMKGTITAILGEKLDYETIQSIVLHSFNIDPSWPKAVTEELSALPDQVVASQHAGRTDLRDMPLVTIDGDDAKDFDDAVYCEKKQDGGWKLLVAIADVSYYVDKDTFIDQEALRRSTSIYFCWLVVPMLPEKLSNGLCSLKPNTDRLCQVCEMHFDSSGRKLSHRFYRGIIRSRARLTYEEVSAHLEQKKELKEPSVGKAVSLLHTLYRLLNAQRRQKGLIELDVPESKFVFDANRKIIDMKPTVRNDAHKLIEEFMLAANIATAEMLSEHACPALYRNHPKPEGKKIDRLISFVGQFGLSLPNDTEVSFQSFSKLLEDTRGRPDSHIFHLMVLRSMQLAEYGEKHQGHFGLHFPLYTHFTSPIRRYPDLVVHRILNWIVDGKIEKPPYTTEQLSHIANKANQQERSAEEASRALDQYLRCCYMQEHLGDYFEGVISAVTSFGLFVSINGIYVEGLIHITSLPKDYYHADLEKYQLVGERTGVVYRLGAHVRVQLAAVDVHDRKIDFILANSKPNGHKRKKRHGKKR